MSPLAHLLVAAIRIYRVLFSPLIGPTCRFAPSCSSYALDAIERHGALGGGWLATRRLLRCHPLHPGGWDPVPGVRNPVPGMSLPGPSNPEGPGGS